MENIEKAITTKTSPEWRNWVQNSEEIPQETSEIFDIVSELLSSEEAQTEMAEYVSEQIEGNKWAHEKHDMPLLNPDSSRFKMEAMIHVAYKMGAITSDELSNAYKAIERVAKF